MASNILLRASHEAATNLRLTLRVGGERVEPVIQEIQAVGIRVALHKRPGRVRVFVTLQEIEDHRPVVEKVLATAYDASAREGE